MACELPVENEMSLSEFIKALYEFDDLDTLYKCVKLLQKEYSLDEVKKLSDEEIYSIFLKTGKENAE